MRIIAIIYLALMIFSKLIELYSFGEERKPYSPTSWTVGLILNLPIYWILIEIINI